jgi:hypothetical protein
LAVNFGIKGKTSPALVKLEPYWFIVAAGLGYKLFRDFLAIKDWGEAAVNTNGFSTSMITGIISSDLCNGPTAPPAGAEAGERSREA